METNKINSMQSAQSFGGIRLTPKDKKAAEMAYDIVEEYPRDFLLRGDFLETRPGSTCGEDCAKAFLTRLFPDSKIVHFDEKTSGQKLNAIG